MRELGKPEGAGAAAAWLAAGLFVAMAGCANPAMPKPPTLNLPQLAQNVTAERVGDQVRVQWTTSAETTDKLKIEGPVTAVICRDTSAKGRPCEPLGREQAALGASEAVVSLPADLLTGPPRAFRLRVELENDRGRSAGRSDAVPVAAGAAPPAVEGLSVTGTRNGALVRWQKAQDGSEVELRRMLVEAAPKTAKASPAKQTGNPQPRGGKSKAATSVTLRAGNGTGDGEGDAGGLLDAEVDRLARYRYTAQRVRKVSADGHALEIRGPESVAVEIIYRDTFALDAPSGLAAVLGEAPDLSIDLSWEASSAADIAGYNVYRRDAGGVTKLTPEPVIAAAFRDKTAKAGVSYTYTVTALDASGNESKPSGEVIEKLP
jgi:hypothetical protein